jgi:hypothetical protein
MPLKAGRLPVPDPLKSIPVPTTASDPTNVKNSNYGGVTVISLPLPLSPPVVLQPGTYDWIQIVSGNVTFQPGIYIIRGTNPVTHRALEILAGQVSASGVMFYITNTTAYTPSTGLPDANDGETTPPLTDPGNTLPSVAINLGLLGSTFSGLNDASSPFHGMFLFQRRHDRRPIILSQENLIGPGQIHGTVYAKWGHVVFAGKGTYNARFVVGTLRIVAVLDLLIQPSELLPPAEDVFLVE